MNTRRGLFGPVNSIFGSGRKRADRQSSRRQARPKPVKIPIYDEEQREFLREASRFNSQLMDYLRPQIRPGVTTARIDQLAQTYTLDHGHTPACLGYHGYPKTICTSINEVVCHGIPNDLPLESGYIVNVDLTTIVNGWHGDQSETFMIGEVTDEIRHLVQVTHDSLYLGIRAVQPNSAVVMIGEAIYGYAKQFGYSIVREYQGHGIGQEFHQDPGIPHFPEGRARKLLLKPGTCFTVEPMLNQGTWRTKLDKQDGWTVRTLDRRLSAQFEHTVLMTEDGPEILTLTKNGPQEGDQVQASV